MSCRELRRQLDLSLYLVTDTALCDDIGVPATVSAAVANGVSFVQLRDPLATDDELVELGRAVAAELKGTDVPLIVNDRVHLVAQIGADGAHIGQDDLDPLSARSQLGPEAVLGVSVQTLEHVQALCRLPPGIVDYLGVGPVWMQTTKTDAAVPGGIERLTEIVHASPWPCVAIGGIDATRIPLVRASGAAGSAVVSAICGQPDPGAATRLLFGRAVAHLRGWRENQ